MQLKNVLPLALLSLLPLASAGNTFVGCSFTLTPGRFAPALPPAGAASPEQCAARCEAGGAAEYSNQITYSFFVTEGESCFCSSVAPAAADYYNAADLGSCDVEQYAIFRIRTTFNFEYCFSGSSNTFSSSSLNGCFSTCAGSLGVDITPFDSGNSFECACATAGQAPRDPETCGVGLGAVYRFSHPALAAASMLPRRRGVKARRAEDYCPGSLTACKLQGSSAYECIDTSSELESCGGCINGLYSASGRISSQGVNCADLGDDVAMTCSAGRCVSAFRG